jgi:hypothetical protein
MRHFKCAPRQLTLDIREKQVTLSKQLLMKVRAARYRDRAHCLTSDESWFSFTIDHE